MTRSSPRFSIIVPLYDMASTIGRAIASVVGQTEANWELIVVDDGSSDDGPASVASVEDARVSLVRQPNAGVSAARNRGVEESRASLVTFLDADDWWTPGHLANLGSLVDEFPEAVLYATAYELVYGTGNTRRVRLPRGRPARALMGDYFDQSVDFEVPVCSSAVAVPKSALAQVGGFPVGVRAGEDLITWARLACLGAVAYSTEATSHVSPPLLAAGARDSALRRPERPDYVGAGLARLTEEHPEHERAIKRYRAWWHRLCALTYAELSVPRSSLRELSKAIALDRPTMRDGMIATLNVLPRTARGRILARTRLRRSRRDGGTNP